MADCWCICPALLEKGHSFLPIFLPYSSYCTREWQIYQYSWSPGASTLRQCNSQLLARPMFLELFRQSNLRWKLWRCCSEKRKYHLPTFQRWGWVFSMSALDKRNRGYSGPKLQHTYTLNLFLSPSLCLKKTWWYINPASQSSLLGCINVF